MEEWQKTLLGLACIAVVVVGGFAAYIGNQRAHAIPEKEKSAIQACNDALRNKYQMTLRQTCLDAGFITREQFYRAPS